MIKFKNIILTGGIDDVWQNIKTKELIIVDYKSQASTKPVETESYLNLTYHEGYKIQMDFYAYLLKRMNFAVSNVSYFLVCNADRKTDGFFGEMKFQEVLIPYQWNSDWVHGKVIEMIDLLNSNIAPDSNQSCKNCAYARQRAAFE